MTKPTGTPKGRPPLGRAPLQILCEIERGYMLFVGHRPELYNGRHIAVDRPDGSVLGWFADEDVAVAAAVRDMRRSSFPAPARTAPTG